MCYMTLNCSNFDAVTETIAFTSVVFIDQAK